MFSVQPVKASVAVRVWPQWTTISASMKTVNEFRSNGPALVADSPLGLDESLVGFSSRSMVAPEIFSC